MKTDDPIIDEIRRVRHEISEKNDHDPKTLVDYYIRTQKQHENKLIYRTIRKPSAEMEPIES